MEALGVGLFFIGSGNALMATDFREEFGLKVPVWVDPKRITYTHLGFKHSVGSVFSPQVLLAGLRATAAGFRQRRTQGDPWQQGGVLVVKRGGALVYGFASEAAGDHPPIDEVMHAARSALD